MAPPDSSPLVGMSARRLYPRSRAHGRAWQSLLEIPGHVLKQSSCRRREKPAAPEAGENGPAPEKSRRQDEPPKPREPLDELRARAPPPIVEGTSTRPRHAAGGGRKKGGPRGRKDDERTMVRRVSARGFSAIRRAGGPGGRLVFRDRGSAAPGGAAISDFPFHGGNLRFPRPPPVQHGPGHRRVYQKAKQAGGRRRSQRKVGHASERYDYVSGDLLALRVQQLRPRTRGERPLFEKGKVAGLSPSPLSPAGRLFAPWSRAKRLDGHISELDWASGQLLRAIAKPRS